MLVKNQKDQSLQEMIEITREENQEQTKKKRKITRKEKMNERKTNTEKGAIEIAEEGIESMNGDTKGTMIETGGIVGMILIEGRGAAGITEEEEVTIKEETIEIMIEDMTEKGTTTGKETTTETENMRDEKTEEEGDVIDTRKKRDVEATKERKRGEEKGEEKKGKTEKKEEEKKETEENQA